MENYLGHEICAFSGNRKSMWLIVYDGKFNYYLFNAFKDKTLIYWHNKGEMPRNLLQDHKQDSSQAVTHGQYKCTKFYTTFDNAVKNLIKVVANKGFFQFRKKKE